MDTSASQITFDSNGNCSFCSPLMKNGVPRLNSWKSSEEFEDLVQKVKNGGVGKEYDCIIGVSGGVDSSWTLVNAVRAGLRPLAVHMDNGWNSELATNNIANLVEILDVDLFTYVIEWEEYRKLMESFFSADVIDIELLYDNAMTEVCYSKAREYGVKYILSGSNTSTEGVKIPAEWAWGDKWDGTNIRSIASLNGAKLVTFPLFTNGKWLYSTIFKGIQWVPFLDFMAFDKELAVSILQSEYAYKPYPYKHYENIFTRFYQGFILPTKFGVDKRRVHFSSLIVSSQMEREGAINMLLEPPFSSAEELRLDVVYFLNKMRWEQKDLEEYLTRARREHSEFKTDRLRKYLWPVLRVFGNLRKVFLAFFRQSTDNA